MEVFDEVIQALDAGANMLLAFAAKVWSIYSEGGIFAIPIVLWILDRLFGIFDILKP